MHEQAVELGRTESSGRTDASHAAKSCPLSGTSIILGQKFSKLFTNLENMQYVLLYNTKNGTKGDTNLT